MFATAPDRAGSVAFADQEIDMSAMRGNLSAAVCMCSALTLFAVSGCVSSAFPLTDSAIAELLQTESVPQDGTGGSQSSDESPADDVSAEADLADSPDDDFATTSTANALADVRLRADLRGAGEPRGQVDYRVEDGRRSFKVEVEHFAAGEYSVRINGVEVLTLSVGSLGFAEVEFDTKSEPGHTPFPPGFPSEIQVGDTIDVAGIVSGTLARDE
jgi:hypothetical protein